MATQVFISWSGDLSRQLAEAVRNWLPGVLQYVKPYFSPDDVEKGAKWNSEIAHELENSHIGLICLTPDNIEKPWILFEAGALSKSFEKSKVCTILFNLETTDLKGPLTGFQTTKFTKEDFKRLISTINNVAGDAKLETSVLDSVFTMWWPRLQEQVSQLLSSRASDDAVDTRSDRDMLEEVLALARMRTSRLSRASNISQRAVRELVECLDELCLMAVHEHGGMGLHLLRRIGGPLRHVCQEAGMPECYERFQAHHMMMMSRMESAEEEAEQSTGGDE